MKYEKAGSNDPAFLHRVRTKAFVQRDVGANSQPHTFAIARPRSAWAASKARRAAGFVVASNMVISFRALDQRALSCPQHGRSAAI